MAPGRKPGGSEPIHSSKRGLAVMKMNATHGVKTESREMDTVSLSKIGRVCNHASLILNQATK